MIPEIGSFALIIALCFAILQFLSPIILTNKRFSLYSANKTQNHPENKSRESCDHASLNPHDNTSGYTLEHRSQNSIANTISRHSALGQCIFLMIALILLIISFLQNDMTVLYVRDHSHSTLPILYKIGAAWGGHEGSLLLWCLILAFWTVAFIIVTQLKMQPDFSSAFNKIVMTLGLISAGFISFLLFTSNPFKRDFPSSLVQGNDLTPLLQDPGLLFHPPSLYLGYVGFAIAFAFAISALIEGKFSKEWVRLLRPWIILPWAYLGCGIVLGSWWAYRELGWGGWWFWDPVENASLLPWLAATALLHSMIVSEKREVFKGWTLLLAILTFGLSLIGTFLVRSGILVSVHTFAADPSRGMFLLSFLTLLIGGAFILYIYRINRFYKAPSFQIFSRETMLLINSIFLLTAMLTIIIGTLYPIILDSLNLNKISVGEPYFNLVFIPLMLPLMLLMGFAPHTNWGQHIIVNLWKKLRLSILLSILLGVSFHWVLGYPFHKFAAVGMMTSFWIIITTLSYAYQKRGHYTIKQWSMILAHLGVAIFILGVTINKSYSEERQVKIHPGETTDLAGYQFDFKKVISLQKDNYQSLTAVFQISRFDEGNTTSVQSNDPINTSSSSLLNKLQLTYLASLFKNILHANTSNTISAEQRIYVSHEQNLNKPGMIYNIFRDLYLALGTSFPDGAWSVRIYYKPAVRWIWFGGFLIVAGGLLTLFSFRRGNQS